jgi:hypothetical protein
VNRSIRGVPHHQQDRDDIHNALEQFSLVGEGRLGAAAIGDVGERDVVAGPVLRPVDKDLDAHSHLGLVGAIEGHLAAGGVISGLAQQQVAGVPVGRGDELFQASVEDLPARPAAQLGSGEVRALHHPVGVDGNVADRGILVEVAVAIALLGELIMGAAELGILHIELVDQLGDVRGVHLRDISSLGRVQTVG